MSESLNEEELSRQYHIEGVQDCLNYSMEYLLEGLEHPKYWVDNDCEELITMLLKVNRESGKFLKKVIS